MVFFLVVRAYIEKPRTLPGFKGFVYQSKHTYQEDLALGLELSRKLFLELADLKIPASMEILDPNLLHYFEDLLSWGFIGARTSSSQIHRQIASACNFPIGFKNTLDGNIELAIQGVNFARSPQNFFHCDEDSKLSWASSKGNQNTHLVLRGSNHSVNYDKQSVTSALLNQLNYDIETPVMIDCSHGNSKKNPDKQQAVFLEMVERLMEPSVFGLMMESNHCEKTSITDPCISLETTERLLQFAHQSCFQTLSPLAN